MKNLLAPSILAADFCVLGEQIREADEAGADYIHIDVMDGMFVPSISFGMPVVSSIRRATGKLFDVHMMVQDPERYLKDFAACGADSITVHAECCRHLDRTLQEIRELGLRAGVALNPATPLSYLDYVLDKTDMVLLMTVNPGFGGQAFIESSLEKIRTLRQRLDAQGLETDIEVDGGINRKTLPRVLEAGANVIVAGSAVFGGDICKNVKELKEMMK
ncbi:ribulose-phosphate 3-epimerase [Marvinbryantia formatexigens DSM 14469]|uniref:Ribulose-phosphate 3-epimerase n=1 Tax=Marvinbryantia formatexigens DSM 14469 TaxID=478749 RepID=C6LGZ1_9FIRM|nr:ribulose-phosphate 3-epimerase [Marvinbryantia formatexigens]EET60050.1 ribulose-phosphate 3-epimerase [Marvinbryantia formatexigens DSM 14469]UWO23848.1 ribulose-phosphate 3-epimerase [Marvinbryantia formatexigens DSM 14469]SDG50279.1 ribulose-phosphate 3-epimerase [Marvinbryantia formatexigens]